MTLDFGSASHRRLNPLTGEWMLVSPHRTQRPWQGKREATPAAPVAPARSDLLPVRGQHAREWRAQPGLRAHLCLRQRLRRSEGRRAGRARRGRSSGRRGRVRDLPGAVLLAAPRPDARRYGRRRHREGGRRLGRGDDQSRRARRHRLRCRSSRTAARSWAARTRIRTARSGRRATCRTSSRRRRIGRPNIS